MLSKRRKILLSVITILLFSIFIPYDLEIAPERRLKIINEDGKPVKNATVTQIWYQYSLDVNGEENFNVNSNGEILLPRRSEHTSLIKVLLGGYKQFSDLGIHASYFSDESFVVTSSKYKERWIYNGNGIGNNVVTLYKAL